MCPPGDRLWRGRPCAQTPASGSRYTAQAGSQVCARSVFSHTWGSNLKTVEKVKELGGGNSSVLGKRSAKEWEMADDGGTGPAGGAPLFPSQGAADGSAWGTQSFLVPVEVEKRGRRAP